MACRKCDLVIMTGGLGPTADDMNRLSVAKLYGVELKRDEKSLENLRSMFASRKRDMPVSNEVQADFPDGAKIIPNHWGTAPGFMIC